MMPSRWQLAASITSFGNAALLLILAGLVAAWLWRSHGARAMLLWCASLSLCAGLTAALKLYFVACPLTELQLRSPSGHTGLSVFVYGGLAFNLSAAGTQRRWLLSGALAWAMAIGWSRVAIRAHSQAEVVFGFAVGAGSLALYALVSLREPRQHLPWFMLAGLPVPILLFAWLFHSFTLEHQLQQGSRWLQQHVGLCAATGRNLAPRNRSYPPDGTDGPENA